MWWHNCLNLFLHLWDHCFHSQLPGEFHGRCKRRLYARQQTPRPASYHSSSNLHCPNTHHLPSGQTSETDHASPTRGGGGTSKPYHLSRALQYAIPWVGKCCTSFTSCKKKMMIVKNIVFVVCKSISGFMFAACGYSCKNVPAKIFFTLIKVRFVK